MKELEAIVDIHILHRQGFSQRAIAQKLGLHRETVKKYLTASQSASEDKTGRPRGSQLDAYRGHLRTWLAEDGGFEATRLYDRLCALGYGGSYDLVRRTVKALKAEQQQIAYVRFETEPGRQAQMDFGEFKVKQANERTSTYYLFAMILGYSRELYAELLSRCDLPSFLEAHLRAFSHFGGSPGEILYDRMKNVYVGQFVGRDRFNPALLSLGLHYGFKPLAAPPRAGWVKGKIERPFDFIREGFWRGYHFSDLPTANKDLRVWLDQKRERVHGTTHEPVSVRFERERPCLQPLPVTVFDTSSRLYRTVGKDCTVRIDGNSYVVDHRLVGKEIVGRIKDNCLRLFDGDHLIVTYEMPAEKGQLVQDKRFYAALREDAAMNTRKYARSAKSGKGQAKATLSPQKGDFTWETEAWDVETRSPEIYDALIKTEAANE